MRVVFGVQLAAPRQVSRMNTWRYPLLLLLAGVLAETDVRFAAWLCVTAKNATKRPEELTEGRRVSAPTSAPRESAATSCVEGLHDSPAPMQVSRKETCRPAGAVSTRC